MNMGLYAYPVLMSADILLYRSVAHDCRDWVGFGACTFALRFIIICGNKFVLNPKFVLNGTLRVRCINVIHS